MKLVGAFDLIMSIAKHAIGQKFTQLACDSQNAEAIIDQELEKFAEQRSYIDTSLVATTRILQQIEVIVMLTQFLEQLTK